MGGDSLISLHVLDVKKCMANMLTGDEFDDFCLCEANIVTGISYVIDGRIVDDFYSEQERIDEGLEQEFIPYKKVKNNCFDIIKGKRTPSGFRFIFLAGKELQDSLLKELDESERSAISNLTMNVIFGKSGLSITTSVTKNIFSMNKYAEEMWDKWVMDFFADMNIASENML